jgi:dipeptidyl aminopeptidase/acylaminoacyl peptidase
MGYHSLFLIDLNERQFSTMILKQTNNNVKVINRQNYCQLYFVRNSMMTPNDVWYLNFTMGSNTDAMQITFENSDLLKRVNFVVPEIVTFTGSMNDEVDIWFMNPLNFDDSIKWPLVLLIHGGPQQSWGDDWSFRWNPQLWTAHGYAVAMINFHGSTGYGQDFTDSISGNWGGYPFDDIMNGTVYILINYQWLYKNKVSACGAYFGCFFIIWFIGNTTRFSSLVVHDGMFDTRAAYYSTEEIWFNEWEFKGQPWNSDLYDKWNPRNLVKNWKTPTLVVHGGRDYRLDLSQGLSTFTTLQRMNITSQFLYFPLENHWVLNPLNGIKWYNTVLSWLDRFNK